MTWLRIHIHEPWHAGSGMGDGPGADALVVRTPSGLPFLPGRTLKGLLRDACRTAEELGHLPKGRTSDLFGDPGDAAAPAGTRRFTTRPGALRLGNAELGQSPEERTRWEAWAQQNPAKVRWLFRSIASTALDKDGVVLHGHLRTAEYAEPVALWAPMDVEDAPDGWKDSISAALPLLRSLGSRRTRGFGRCTVEVAE